MKIRKAKISEAKEISKLMLNNLNLLSSKKYSEEQISAMKKYVGERNIKDYIKKFEVFVVLEKNKVIGTVSLEDNLIFSIYVKDSTNFVKMKVGNEMLKFMEDYLKELGRKEVFLISMPTTKNFFEKRGYRLSEKLLLKFDGVDFPEFKLKKVLK
tara:strand:- start:3666 stop:4130 length:465 start_codon:yes stop_codon:yes gene_type:complete